MGMGLGLLRRGGVLSGVKSPVRGRKGIVINWSLDHSDGFPETVSNSVSFGTSGRRTGVRGGEVKRNPRELGRDRESGVARGVTNPRTWLLRCGVEGMFPANGVTLVVFGIMTTSS
jgi:hypothetical protein